MRRSMLTRAGADGAAAALTAGFAVAGAGRAADGATLLLNCRHAPGEVWDSLSRPVQEQIIGNCLCVLGDAMAMPIGSMVEKFRSELEAEIEAARERAEGAELAEVIPVGVADERAGPYPVH